MIVTYFRSSSYNCWDMCPQQYFLQYVLGMKAPSGKKADKGNVVHKALELLARWKLALQEGRESFRDDELNKDFAVADFAVPQAVGEAWGYYTKGRASHHDWKPYDLRDCAAWTNVVLEYNGGMFSPLKRHVVSPEQYFDFEIDQPWAKYHYRLPDGRELSGRLAIKGTVDLVTQVRPGVLEYLDWKTGRRLDWATGQEKTYAKLCDDPQLRLYHYALCRLYPDVDEIFVTIFYSQDGGPFSICFHRGDLEKTEDMIRRRFEVIKNTLRPKLHKSWKCEKICHFGKTLQPGTDKTICAHVNDELVSLGMDRVLQKYGDLAAIGRYGDGGGRSGEKTGR